MITRDRIIIISVFVSMFICIIYYVHSYDDNYYITKTHSFINTYLLDQIEEENICETESFEYEENFVNDGVNLPGFYRKLTDKCRTNQLKEIKYIYMDHDYWGYFGNHLDKVFDRCPINDCFVTLNKSMKPIDEYDAIIFSIHNDNFKSSDFQKRSAHQKYIYFTPEAPYSTKGIHVVKDFFNWSMNYRRDADIHFPYGVIKRQQTNYIPPHPDKIGNKTKMAAWLVSNCGTPGTKRRKDYVQELQKYIQVDVYGKCGPFKCNTTEDCYKMFESDYYFYLAFENSMCFDYVTEKMYNMLNLDIIPVVMGYSDYSSITPVNSVINIDKFPSPKELASYLIKVSRDIDLYLKYMEWKKEYVVQHPTEYVFCQLCDLLHRPLHYSTHHDLIEWSRGLNCYIYS